VKLRVTHVNEVAETIDFVFGNTEFIVLVVDGKKGLRAIVSDDDARDLPNWVLAKCRTQATSIIRDRRARSLKRRGRLPKTPEQLKIPGV